VARGIKLRRSGKELIGLCPFHKDTNPSLNIDPVKNVWQCKGACGKSGSVIDWVMLAEGVSVRHALELLCRDYFPSAANATEPAPRKSTTVKLPQLVEHTADDKQLLERVVSHYHEALKNSPAAQQYLVKRGLQSPEMVEQFRLGFADRSLGYRVPASNRAAAADQRGRLTELGVFRKNGREHLRGSRHTTPKITSGLYAQAVSADQQKAHKKVVQMMLPAKFPEKLKARSSAPTG
jgi:DNA primase